MKHEPPGAQLLRERAGKAQVSDHWLRKDGSRLCYSANGMLGLAD